MNVIATTGTSSPGLARELLYEVIHGQRVELPPMGIYAHVLASRLQNRLGPFVEQRCAGIVVTEALFILDADSDLRRRPDVAFVSTERWPLDRPLPESGDWEVSPDLAVEIASPNDLYEQVLAKVREYFEYQVRQVWVIAPTERLVTVFDSPTQVRVLDDTTVLAETVVLEFTLPLAELFQKRGE